MTALELLLWKSVMKFSTFAFYCRSVTGNSIADHLNYYGVDLMCQQWRSCRIVMDPRVAEYGETDHKGNIVLSRDPAIVDLKMNSQSNEGGVTSST